MLSQGNYETRTRDGRCRSTTPMLGILAGPADRRFDAVVTYKAERFARRMVLALAYEEELRLANISIYVSDEAGEPGRPTSVLTRRIKQAVGEWYVLLPRPGIAGGGRPAATG